MKPKNNIVSIGIPFYNAEDYICYAIRSVINQSYINWELILLDDGSTDNSLKIAESFKDKRIQVISDGINKGLVYRLNQLSTLAKGKYYARMDADDVMHPDRIKKQIDYLDQNPKIDIVGSGYYSIDKENNIIGIKKLMTHPDSAKQILSKGCFAHPTIMGKRDWFINNPYNETFVRMEDLELWLRTVNYSNFINLDKPLLYYRSIGVPTFKKYIDSNLGIIKLLCHNRKYKINFFVAKYFQFANIIKILIYALFSFFGLSDILIKLRTSPISDQKKKTIKIELENAIR